LLGIVLGGLLWLFGCFFPEIINLWRRKVCFGSQFWRFQPIINWAHCFGPEVRQHTMVGRECMEWGSGNGRGKEEFTCGDHSPPSRACPIDQRIPTRSHILKVSLPPSGTMDWWHHFPLSDGPLGNLSYADYSSGRIEALLCLCSLRHHNGMWTLWD
jgi:hypothetical protein